MANAPCVPAPHRCKIKQINMEICSEYVVEIDIVLLKER